MEVARTQTTGFEAVDRFRDLETTEDNDHGIGSGLHLLMQENIVGVPDVYKPFFKMRKRTPWPWKSSLRSFTVPMEV